jgi:hypothetical protein
MNLGDQFSDSTGYDYGGNLASSTGGISARWNGS